MNGKIAPEAIAIAAGLGAVIGLVGVPGIPGAIGGAVCLAAAETAVEAFSGDSARLGFEPKPMAIAAVASAATGSLLFGAPLLPVAIAGVAEMLILPWIAIGMAGGMNGRGR